MNDSERAADAHGDGEAAVADGSASDSIQSTLDASDQPLSLGSRILITWSGLTAVAVIGGFRSSSVSGPVGFIRLLAASLASVGILLYNVNELVKRWVAAGQVDSVAE